MVAVDYSQNPPVLSARVQQLFGMRESPRIAGGRVRLTVELTDEAKEFLIKKGSNTDYGARPLRRAIETFVEDPLAEELLKGEFAGKDLIKIEVKKVEIGRAHV